MEIPALVKILFFLFIALAGLVFFAEKNPVHLSPERQAMVGKIIMVLIGVGLIAAFVRTCTG